MTIFDSLKRRPIPPDDLRSALIDAVAREDWNALAALCERHQDGIREAFPQWKTVPPDVRLDPEAQGRYARTLITVAQLFEQAGDSSLIAALMGNQADNPIAIWQRALATAQSLLDQEQPREAADLLQSTIGRCEALQGDAVAHYLPRLLGMLGVALFRAGDATRAIESTRRARDLCEKAGDAEGVAVYEGNLRRMKEEPAVVFRDAEGQVVSPSELRGATGTFRYEVEAGTPVSPEAKELHQRARQAGSQGQYQEAMALLKEAAVKAPHWPYPLYDMAFTLLLMNDVDGAIERYRETLALSPRGFFTAITALHTLEREKRGELPAGLYLAYVSLDRIEDRAQRAEIARGIVAKVPAFAPAWKEIAAHTDQEAERLAAIRRGLAASPDPETKGTLQIQESFALHARGDRDAAVHLLESLARDPSSTFATEQLAKAALAALPRAR